MNGLPDGYGEFTWKDGSYHKGLYKEGKKDGKGKMFKKSQIDQKRWILYEGDFRNDKRHGYGHIKWSDGSEYKGEFDSNEKRTNKGEMRWHDGSVYIGEWSKGKQFGWGSLRTSNNNEIKTGYFVNNKYIGNS